VSASLYLSRPPICSGAVSVGGNLCRCFPGRGGRHLTRLVRVPDARFVNRDDRLTRPVPYLAKQRGYFRAEGAGDCFTRYSSNLGVAKQKDLNLPKSNIGFGVYS